MVGWLVLSLGFLWVCFWVFFFSFVRHCALPEESDTGWHGHFTALSSILTFFTSILCTFYSVLHSYRYSQKLHFQTGARLPSWMSIFWKFSNAGIHVFQSSFKLSHFQVTEKKFFLSIDKKIRINQDKKIIV